MNLQDTLKFLVEREGGYVNDPNDNGGETNFGITVAVARAFGYAGPMVDLPRTTALQIYRERYWLQPRFDQVARLSTPIAEELLDTGVNMGTATGVKFMQRALNVLNKQGKLFTDISRDGSVGKMTLAALKGYLGARGTDGETVLLRMMNGQQSVRYIELAEAAANQELFEFGWQLSRVKGTDRPDPELASNTSGD